MTQVNRYQLQLVQTPCVSYGYKHHGFFSLKLKVTSSTLFLSDELQEKLKTEREAKNHLEKKYNSLKGMKDENSFILSVYSTHIVVIDLHSESIND